MPIDTDPSDEQVLEAVVRAMSDQPWGITPDQGRTLFNFVLKEKPERMLELGCGIGTSACYIAAALSRLGRGKVTSIDCNPDLPEWVGRTFAKVDPKFRSRHELIVTPTSYNDELLTIIEAQTKDGVCVPCYDFCFIDGAHTWEVDGCAFFLSDKLLKPGGWMLFDDVAWTIAGSAEAMKRRGSQAPLTKLDQTPQVERIVSLLVAQHPGYEQLTLEGDWAWARKRGSAQSSASNPIVDLNRPQLLPRAYRGIKRRLRSVFP